MHPQWRQKLEALGAQFDDDEAVADFGDPAGERQAAQDRTVLADLAPLGLVAVTGADAADFLQAQLSNDVLRLGAARSALAAWCDAKGRTLAVLRVLPLEEGYALQLPQALVPSILQRLQMFVLRADVRLRDIGDEWVRLGLFGPGAGEALGEWMMPPEPGCVSVTEDTQVLSVPGPQPRYQLLAPTDRAGSVWDRLAVRARPVGSPLWRLSRIAAGQPQLYPATSARFVPQMLNLHWLDGVDFAKGCYPGQEVVARLQHRGRLKQRVYRIRAETGPMPQPGDAITDPDGERLGTLLDAAREDEDHLMALAVLRVDAADAPLRLGEAAVELLDLPYTTPA